LYQEIGGGLMDVQQARAKEGPAIELPARGGFGSRVSGLIDQIQALEDEARAAGLSAIAARLRHARQALVEAALSAMRWQPGDQ
jgi:hypothetical protein